MYTLSLSMRSLQRGQNACEHFRADQSSRENMTCNLVNHQVLRIVGMHNGPTNQPTYISMVILEKFKICDEIVAILLCDCLCQNRICCE